MMYDCRLYCITEVLFSVLGLRIMQVIGTLQRQVRSTRKICLCLLAVAGAALLTSMRSTIKLKLTGVVQSQNVPAVKILDRINGDYYNFSNAIFRLYAYSAFYDDRPSLLSPPVIRVIAISDDLKTLKKHNVTRLYCVLHHQTKDIVMYMTETPKSIGYGWPMNKFEAHEYIYTCPIVKGMIPNSVSIVTSQTELFSSGVPLTFPNKPKVQRDFSVCVQAVYGSSLDPYRVIEWLELQKILGVEFVGVYILSASEEILKIFRHYSREGFVELRKINYIYSNYSEHSEFWLHLTPAINDCIYRHMYEFRRMLVVDFDEIILPRKHYNLTELVAYLDRNFLERKSPRVNYAFRNNYFFLDLTPNRPNISQYLTFLRFQQKTAVSGEGYSEKSIINPQACTHMHNHHCWGVTSNFTKYDRTGFVNPEIALNQHYKRCHFSPAECDAMMKNVTQDNSMIRFKDILTESVREKVKLLMGHSI